MEICSFSIDELKKKAVEIRLSILNAVAGAVKGHIGAVYSCNDVLVYRSKYELSFNA